MTNATVTTDFGNLDDYIMAVGESVKTGIEKSAMILSNEMRRSMTRSASGEYSIGEPSAPGQPPHAQTARLRGSIGWTKAEVEPGSILRVSARAGTNVPYGLYLEYGANPRSKGKKLAVPIGAKGRRAAAKANGNIRSLDLTFIKRRGRPPLLARVYGGKRARVEPLFVLVDSTRIAPRPWARPAMIRSQKAMQDGFVNASRKDLARRVVAMKSGGGA